jgi:DNA (cytosine-5)-methyltransferase 1
VFVVVDFGGAVDPAAVLLEPDRLRGDSPPRREAGEGPAPTVSERTKGDGGLGTDFDCDGGLIPHCADIASTLNAAFGSKLGLEDQHINAGAPLFVAQVTDALTAHNGQRNEVSDMTNQIIAFGAQNAAAQGDGVCIDFVAALDKSKTPAVAFAIQERAVSENLNSGPQGKGYQDELSYTLEARNKVQSVATDWAVRRLTPTECHRLQGFPDDHCDVPRGKLPGAPDGQQYKALGNSMAVPVMRWILDRVRISATAHRKPQLQTLFDGAAE